MAKRKKSFFEKLTEVNDNFDEKFKKTLTKKKRNWINISILSTLGIGVIAGISIPLAINTTKVNYQEPESNDKTIIEYKDGEGNLLYSANVKLISDLLKDNNLLKKEKINDLYRKLIFKLYEEEVDASETYQRLYNNSLTEFESVRTDIALKSLSEVRKDKIKYLEDQRNNVRQNYPFETFENVWNQKLQSDEFGKSKTFDEAVEYLTFKQVENDAKRRYEIEIKQQDLSFINRTAKRDIFKQDKNGNLIKNEKDERIVLFSKDQKVFDFYKENETYYTDSSIASRVITITTKSFIPEFKNVNNLVSDYFNKYNLNLATSIILPGVQNNNDLTQPFTFDKDNAKDKLIHLLQYSVDKKSDGSPVLNSNLDILKSFKEASYYSLIQENETYKDYEKRKSNYQLYLGALTTTNSTNLGTKGLTTFDELLKDDINAAIGTQYQEIFENNDNKLPEIDLNKIFKLPSGINNELESKIKEKLEKAKEITNTNDSSKFNEFVEEIVQVNKYIKQLINGMSNLEFNNFIKSNFNNNFNKEFNTKSLTSFAYNVKDMPGNLLIPSSNGLVLLKNTNILSLQEFNDFIKSDLINILKGNVSYFKLNEKLSKTLPEEEFIDEVLKTQKYKEFLLEVENPFSQSKETKFTENDINELLSIAKSISIGKSKTNNLSLITNINNWIKEKYNTKTSMNIIFKDGELKIGYYNKTNNELILSEKNAFDLIQNIIDTKLSKGEK
ncbi:hypothetical protein RRG54_01555 [Mycoplasmopsis felis]|uniref:HinT-interacting membrane complex protein P80 n=1 Tax=Mycoplasmopsis felis TaxID=33923 RepID=UPI00300D0518